MLHRREIVEARAMTKSAQPDLHARARTCKCTRRISNVKLLKAVNYSEASSVETL